VKVKFRLYYDGRVTDFEIVENNSGDIQGLLCEKAILENVPYRQWPSDLRRIVEKDYRELRFTFYYNFAIQIVKINSYFLSFNCLLSKSYEFVFWCFLFIGFS